MVNSAMTATYWLIGRRIVEEEQRGVARADYGERLVKRLACDLSKRFGRGFSKRSLWKMRAFYLAWPLPSAASAKSPVSSASVVAGKIVPTVSAQLVGTLAKECAARFSLPWSHYVRLLAVRSAHGRAFYEGESLRGGWTIRQLDRQIQSQFYERTALSRDRVTLLGEGDRRRVGDNLTPEEEIKDPYVLEFLGLKDEYSESELETLCSENSNPSSSSWEATSPSWGASTDYVSVTSGTEWICYFSTADCDVSLSLISNSANSRMPMPDRCTCT